MANVVGSLVVRLSAHIADFITGCNAAVSTATTTAAKIQTRLGAVRIQPFGPQREAGMASQLRGLTDWGSAAQRVFDSTRTPLDRYRAGLAELQSIQKRGLIDAVTYTRAIGNLRAELLGTVGPLGAFKFLMTPAGMFLAGAAGAAMITRELFHMAEAAHQVEKEAEKLSIGIGAYQRLAIVAELSATEIGFVTTTIRRMQRAIAEASMGGGKQEPFRRLGVDAKELMQLAPDQAFTKLAKAISSIQNPMERTRLEIALFGRGGAELDLVLKNLSGKLSGLKLDVLTPSELSTKTLAKAGEQAEVLRLGMRRLKTEAGAGLLMLGTPTFYGATALRDQVKEWWFGLEKAQEKGKQLDMQLEPIQTRAARIADYFSEWDLKIASVGDSSAEAAQKLLNMGGKLGDLTQMYEAADKFDKAKKRESDIANMRFAAGNLAAGSAAAFSAVANVRMAMIKETMGGQFSPEERAARALEKYLPLLEKVRGNAGEAPSPN